MLNQAVTKRRDNGGLSFSLSFLTRAHLAFCRTFFLMLSSIHTLDHQCACGSINMFFLVSVKSLRICPCFEPFIALLLLLCLSRFEVEIAGGDHGGRPTVHAERFLEFQGEKCRCWHPLHVVASWQHGIVHTNVEACNLFGVLLCDTNRGLFISEQRQAEGQHGVIRSGF